MSTQLSARRMLTALLIFVASLAAFTAHAEAKGKAKVKVTVTVATKNQASLVKAKKLVVKVRATGKAKVKVTAAQGRRSSYFKAANVRFRKKGVKTVSLRLTAGGRRQLAKCGAQVVKVTATYKRGKRKAKSARSKKLAKWAGNGNCVKYVQVPLGSDPEHCDFLDSTVCLQPWPNDYYTKEDSSTQTGRRLDIDPQATPMNIENVHISVEDINRGDGFSPGNLISLKVPGLDTPQAFENNHFVGLDDLHAYDDPDQRVLLIDAETGERQPIWAEIDSNPTAVDPVEDVSDGGIDANPSNTKPVNLLVRPAKNLEWGHRYIVAFRDLVDANGKKIQSPLGFRVYRDRLKTRQSVVEKRRGHMNELIGDLTGKAGVDRASLYMAWDFTVASQQSVTGRALEIRDDAFARLNDNNLANRVIEGDSPQVDVTYVCDRYDNPDEDNPTTEGCKGGPNKPSPDKRPSVPGSNVIRIVDGFIRNVPCYLNQDGCPPGAVFDHKADGSLDIHTGYKMDVPFRCIVPQSVQPGGEGTAVIPGQAGIYGHGLLGSLEEVTASGATNLGNAAGSVWCGANWDGFSSSDFVQILDALGDMSHFPKMADRMQQGFVNFMMLQRAMVHEDGFAAQSAFQLDPDGAGGQDPVSVIDVSDFPNTRGAYYGISQGGIMGGALMALSPDSDYGVLGVPGMNYSTLLRRSVDSDRYFKNPNFGLYMNYPDEHERPVLLSLVQLLWDRGEANGYANNMTVNPLPDTPEHRVLLEVAYGDHQVTNYAAEVEARTIGAAVYSPALNANRYWDVDPFLGMEKVSSFPHGGDSMLVYYDSGPVDFVGDGGPGIGNPPIQNLPPRTEWGFGRDPHSDPRRSPDGIGQAKSFLADGTIPSCEVTSPVPAGDAHCYANSYAGPTP
ncbi:MAG: hypothetical protein J0H98_00405 [Solirubrobacterales bacterium]|nr:hypothetical protein [Solirubrobacterales bacterium]